jgi:hypothetical protein
MELPPSTSTPWFSASTFQLIDRPFDHRPIRKERFDKPFYLVAKMKKGLPKPAESLSL